MLQNIQTLLGPAFSRIVSQAQHVSGQTIHQVNATFENHRFYLVLQEKEDQLIVLSVILERKLMATMKGRKGDIDVPIMLVENHITTHMQTLHNFPLDADKLSAICQKMIHMKIEFTATS